MPDVDALVVGAGPAGLSAAIRLRQRLTDAGRDASVAVLDKAAAPGYHNLSGAIVEPAALDELLPDWRADRTRFADQVTPVEQDDLYLLTDRGALALPPRLVPGSLRHAGDVTLSVSRLSAFLADRADRLGVELYHGFAARGLLVEAGRVGGIRLVDQGLDAAGDRQSNFLAGEEVRASVTVVADGSHGVLSCALAALDATPRDPQVYGLGIKAVVQFGGPNPFGTNRVLHTLGSPSPRGVFGGGFLYSLGAKQVAVGLILGLDWRYVDLDPRAEFEAFRAHPFVARLLDGSTTVATGARTIPEGGYYALGPLTVPGALVVGDAAGFVNEAKLKGVHYAMRSGMCAADAIADAWLAGEPIDHAGARYRRLLEERGILGELRHARNYRQGFRWGMAPGAVLSVMGDRLPVHLRMEPDRVASRRGARLGRHAPRLADGAGFVGLTGTGHREDEPSHVTLLDPARCATCGEELAACTSFCPGEVYRWGGGRILVSASNCLHCMTCAVKCPEDNIRWAPPEGGEGPRYRQM